MESHSPSQSGAAGEDKKRHRPLGIEQLCFESAMTCFEGRLQFDPAIGPLTMKEVTNFISRTLEKTHNLKDVRETLSKSVEVWLWLTKCFAAAIPGLTTRSIGPLSAVNNHDNGVTPRESTKLIIHNYASLKEDLSLLSKLMHIARNLLVVPEPEIPQDLCAAVQFDQMLYQTIVLCINVTSKAYDGDVLEETARLKLTEITELYKKLLVTCLQQAHNWIAKNDRNKMTFWSTVLFDDDAMGDEQDPNSAIGDFRPDIARTEVRNWMERNSRFCDKAQKLLIEYEESISENSRTPPGHLPPISPLAWNWLPEGTTSVRADNFKDDEKITPVWKEDELNKFEQDRLYGRVSREVDTWWLRARDPNYDDWVVPMPTVEFAQQRTENSKANLVNRYAHSYRAEDQEGSVHSNEGAPLPDHSSEDGTQESHYPQEYNDDMIDDEDVDDDESYGEGPMSGFLTEVPNILDPKQIEALHMIIKSCILDNAGLALSRAGENLQKTRCRMFLALECGRSLLREILVFIAVWEKNEQSLIFQLTTQIVEAIHHSALIPYAWSSLRIPKDIISPAQTVLLRLVNNMFRARNTDPPLLDSKEHLRDVKLLHFLFIQFRSRIVPECVALMHLQAQIRSDEVPAVEFPVDSWDMERAKDGLQQFLELLTTVNELPETRVYLIEWEAAYELLVLLKGLEAGVPKKPLVELPRARQQGQPPSNEDREQHHEFDAGDPPPPPPPPPTLQDFAHQFPWAGIKGQILHILAGLLQPPPGRSSPGNPEVQKQIIRHNGIVSLLNCCVYDDHNRYARERVQVCLKWLMDGSDAANNFLRELVAMSPPPNLRPQPGPDGQPPTTTMRIDGIAGEVKVRMNAPSPPPWAAAGNSSANSGGGGGLALPSLASSTARLTEDLRNVVNTLPPIIQSQSQSSSAAVSSSSAAAGPSDLARSRSEDLLRDIITLADEAARLAIVGPHGHRADADETEEEDFM
ncbi:hypothetical protein B0H66DRAFT_534442 [Apodospora peruviana]|uniref:Ataxin-10 homolog n=1 Tax=Apodospora peruviana TaxID=516989 RepID=A0AAE0I084_9PEZI|nr:hypothetical protein B0H66DRAFT_534442 [Apodospora peruviana]